MTIYTVDPIFYIGLFSAFFLLSKAINAAMKPTLPDLCFYSKVLFYFKQYSSFMEFFSLSFFLLILLSYFG